MEQKIPIDDVLFVFNQWTLMLNSNYMDLIKLGDEVKLVDAENNMISTVILRRYLPSKNPDISPVVINVITQLANLKMAKYIVLKSV